MPSISKHFFDNSKEALTFIFQNHGADVLLGDRLKFFFLDYAPNVSALRKNVVFSVYTSGATSILKKHSSSPTSEQEIACKQAIQKIIDTFGTEQSLAEEIIWEFAEALGWKTKEKRDLYVFNSGRNSNPSIQAQPLSADSRIQTNTILTQGGDIIVEILSGKKRKLQFGEYTWRALDVRDSKALLLTEDIVLRRSYSSNDYSEITWADCELRRYLNSEFLEKFTTEDRLRIYQTSNNNHDNQWFKINGGDDTTDKVFLLSIEEVVKYFGDSGKLNNRPLHRSANQVIRPTWISDEFNNERKTKSNSWWWLRSPGDHSSKTAIVRSDGGGFLSGYSGSRHDGSVRPALWLSLC